MFVVKEAKTSSYESKAATQNKDRTDDEHCLCELIVFFLRFDILVWRIFVFNGLLSLIVLGSYKHITSNNGSKGKKV